VGGDSMLELVMPARGLESLRAVNNVALWSVRVADPELEQRWPDGLAER